LAAGDDAADHHGRQMIFRDYAKRCKLSCYRGHPHGLLQVNVSTACAERTYATMSS